MQAQTMLVGNLPLREKISHIFLSFCHINLTVYSKYVFKQTFGKNE